jgi:endonuclease YncB( thermonuclease family)
MNKIIFLQVILLCVIVVCAHQAGTISCTEIIDGDTFRLLNGDTVRLIGIDAPELSQPGGESSREYLAHLIVGKPITLERGYEDRDKYNRLLRFVYINDLCINEEMIRQGYAIDDYFSTSTSWFYVDSHDSHNNLF